MFTVVDTNILTSFFFMKDPDDIDFFAVALLLDAIIWSREKRLKKRDKVEVLNISEMEHLLSLIE